MNIRNRSSDDKIPTVGTSLESSCTSCVGNFLIRGTNFNSETEDDEIEQSEVRSLITAMAEFKLNEGLIITDDLDKEEVVDNKTIVYKPLWKWLLGFGIYDFIPLYGSSGIWMI